MSHEDVPEFQVKARKYTATSTIISLRIPKDMVETLDGVAEQTGRTRNEIITMGLEFALEHLSITEI